MLGAATGMRRHVDDAPSPAFHQAAGQALAQDERCVDVDGERSPSVCGVYPADRLSGCHPRAIDHDVPGPGHGQGLVYHGLCAAEVAQISPDRRYRRFPAGRCGAGFGQRIEVAADNRDQRAGIGQRMGHLAPQPTRAPGHEGAPAR